ncbi:AMSH-like ubiquitin thioesterase 3 [Linum perenne]
MNHEIIVKNMTKLLTSSISRLVPKQETLSRHSLLEPNGLGVVMDSVLSLDDGKWIHPTEELGNTLVREAREDPFHFVGIRQPSAPPVLAQVQHEYAQIPPSKVADPRPGLAPSQDGMSESNSFRPVHMHANLMDDFLRLARENTDKNMETCGVLAGASEDGVFHISMLIIPKQTSTSNSVQYLFLQSVDDPVSFIL